LSFSPFYLLPLLLLVYSFSSPPSAWSSCSNVSHIAQPPFLRLSLLYPIPLLHLSYSRWFFAVCFSWVTAYIVHSSLILSTLMMEAIYSSETSLITRATLHHIPEDGILFFHYVLLLPEQCL
jgi:hypothetical protein